MTHLAPIPDLPCLPAGFWLAVLDTAEQYAFEQDGGASLLESVQAYGQDLERRNIDVRPYYGATMAQLIDVVASLSGAQCQAIVQAIQRLHFWYRRSEAGGIDGRLREHIILAQMFGQDAMREYWARVLRDLLGATALCERM